MKYIYEKPTANVILNSKIMNVFTWRWGKSQECPLSQLLFGIVLGLQQWNKMFFSLNPSVYIVHKSSKDVGNFYTQILRSRYIDLSVSLSFGKSTLNFQLLCWPLGSVLGHLKPEWLQHSLPWTVHRPDNTLHLKNQHPQKFTQSSFVFQA